MIRCLILLAMLTACASDMQPEGRCPPGCYKVWSDGSWTCECLARPLMVDEPDCPVHHEGPECPHGL